MLQIPRRTLRTVLIAVAALTLVGATVGAFMAFLPDFTGGGSTGPGVDSAKSTESANVPPAATTQTDPRSVVVNGVALTLVDITRSTNPKGVEVVIDLANQSNGAVAFAFFPERDITLGDDQGSNYNFRWAEYKGEVKVEAGQESRLVRVFFAGPDRDVKPERLTVRIANVPQIGRANWEVDWPASATKPSSIVGSTPAPAAVPEPDRAANGIGAMVTQNKISLTLTAADLDTQLGGLVVTIYILNNTSGDLNLLFSPERQLAVVDNRGNKFGLRWAEYSGATMVARGQQVQLVKAFFDGSVTDPLLDKLTISVVSLPEFGAATWQVPLKR